MILPGVLLREILKRLNVNVAILSFFSLVIAMMIFYPVKDIYYMTYLTINRLLCPILIFTILLSTRQFLSRSNLLIDFGKLSFRIYLIHIFLYNAFYIYLDKYSPGIFFGLGIFIACLGITYIISKIPFMKYVFPRHN